MTRLPTEMELRVAKALEPEAFGPRDESRLDVFYDNLQASAISQARAAIRAMRVPTRAMFEAADVWGDPDGVWATMIDAASPPESA